MRVLLIDADGVTLLKGEYFSEKYIREYDVSKDDVAEFFKGPFIACQKGEADLKQVIIPYLEKWGWQKSVDDFLDYWFSSDVIPNSEIEETLAKFKSGGVRIYLASNNEKYRAQEIEKVLMERGLLDGFYFSSTIKARKEDLAFFQYVLQDLVLEPKDVVFVDNDQKNIVSATSVGIESYMYNSQAWIELLEKFK